MMLAFVSICRREQGLKVSLFDAKYKPSWIMQGLSKVRFIVGEKRSKKTKIP